jgi:Fic family protein
LDKLGIIMKMPEKPPKISEKPTYSEIMGELIKLGKFSDFFRIDDTEYPYWEEWKYKTNKWGVKSEKIWSCVKSHRRGSRKIYLSSLPGFSFSLNTPPVLQEYLHTMDMNLGGNLQSESIIPSEDKDRYLISSIMEEAIASSQLEGAATTRKVAREMLEKDKKPQNRSERMIMNNYETMQWIVKNKDQKLTSEVLLAIHSLVTKDTMEDKEEEGSFRSKDNITVNDDITNEVFYIPPSHRHINQLIKDFCKFANDEDKDNVFIHPIVKGIILHFLVGYIHPFTDGNGRTARAIFYWYLIRKGYWLIEYMSVSRIILRATSQYARAYLHTEYDENDLTYFVLYNIKAIKAALDDLKKYIQAKQQEKQKVLALIRHTDFNDRQIVLIKDILQDKNQYFTVKQIESRFKVSNQTARNDLTGLVEKGILEQKVTGKRVQFFAAYNFEQKLKIKK